MSGEERREQWKTLARELHQFWCMDYQDDPEPDWKAAESCHAFASSVLDSDWLAARVASAAAENATLRARLDEARALAVETASVYNEHHDAASAAPIGDPLRKVHTELGHLAHAVLAPAADAATGGDGRR